jgi:hypothetical protein
MARHRSRGMLASASELECSTSSAGTSVATIEPASSAYNCIMCCGPNTLFNVPSNSGLMAASVASCRSLLSSHLWANLAEAVQQVKTRCWHLAALRAFQMGRSRVSSQ